MILNTRYGPETKIPDDQVEKLLGMAILRITSYVERYALKEGYILMRQSKPQKEGTRVVRWNIYKSLDDALIGCVAANAGYGADDLSGYSGELAYMDEAIVESMDLCYALVNWTSMTAADRRAMQERIQVLVDDLARVQAAHKVSMHKRLSYASAMHDSLGRPNPGVIGNRLAWTAKDGKLRQEEIRGIATGMGLRERVLLNEIQRNISTMRQGYQTIDKWIAGGRPPFVTQPRMELTKSLSKTPDRPFRHAFRRTANDLRKAMDELTDHQVLDAWRWAGWSLANLEKQRWIVSIRLRLRRAQDSRTADREIQMQQLFDELALLRANLERELCQGNRCLYMNRVRQGIDLALAEWRAGHMNAVREALSETSNNAF
ncbi:MAG: hypothetical protein ABIA47_04160 [bacterium]